LVSIVEETLEFTFVVGIFAPLANEFETFAFVLTKLALVLEVCGWQPNEKTNEDNKPDDKIGLA
jgi:hypothetical protein